MHRYARSSDFGCKRTSRTNQPNAPAQMHQPKRTGQTHRPNALRPRCSIDFPIEPAARSGAFACEPNSPSSLSQHNISSVSSQAVVRPESAGPCFWSLRLVDWVWQAELAHNCQNKITSRFCCTIRVRTGTERRPAPYAARPCIAPYRRPCSTERAITFGCLRSG